MPKTKKTAKRALLMSVIMSSPAPIVGGISLFFGNSSTQTADFIRRTSEFLVIVMSFIVYKIAESDRFCDEDKKHRLEIFSNLSVGLIMSIAGLLMTVLSFTTHSMQKGNVIPGLAIALLSGTANAVFWSKYERLGKKSKSPILSVQARLYRAKTLIDGFVAVTLAAVTLFPESRISHLLDIGAGAIVALYLLRSGLKTVLESARALKSKRTDADT